jgi:Ulp1 protease family, C-terminal catalytic domain
MSLQVTCIPHQDNYHDCGLYTLTYLEFFAFKPPRAIHRQARGHLSFKWGPGGAEQHPTFLTERWFRHENGSNLRKHLKRILLSKLEANFNNDLPDAPCNEINAHKASAVLTCFEDHKLDKLPDSEKYLLNTSVVCRLD